MHNVYLVSINTSLEQATIVARDKEEAVTLFDLWREEHAPHAIEDGFTMVLLTEHDLAQHPQLQEAVLTGCKGVAWWIGHREGWLIAPADGDEEGLVAPPQTTVGCFVFPDTEDFGTVYVFAETEERAIAMLHLHSLDKYGWDASYKRHFEMSPWLLQGEKITLREEMFAGRVGIGRQDADGVWHILPADYRNPSKRRIRHMPD